MEATFTNKAAANLAGEILGAGNKPRFFQIEALKRVESIRPGYREKVGTWENCAYRLRLFIEGKTEFPPFSIFARGGNSKLPFHAFSSLPGFDCPGAGPCLYNEKGEWGKGFCYSFKSWRYPLAFFRQLQNSWLLRYDREKVAHAFQEIPKGEIVRLYVDGDFYSLECFNFWMEEIANRKDLRVYGYSKSWEIILDSKVYLPGNYFLNLSSGSKYGKDLRDKMASLSITRGEFVAVQVARKWITSRAYQDQGNEGSREYRREVRERLKETFPGKKVFACPGNCGNCIPKGRHACEYDGLKGVVIGIGIHG